MADITHGEVRQQVLDNKEEVRKARREWHAKFDGDYCIYGGRDWNFVQGGTRNAVPGTDGASWKEAVVIASSGATQGILFQRGLMADLLNLPGNHGLDLFIVEAEPITEDDVDVNGRYWYERVTSDNIYAWNREK